MCSRANSGAAQGVYAVGADQRHPGEQEASTGPDSRDSQDVADYSRVIFTLQGTKNMYMYH